MKKLLALMLAVSSIGLGAQTATVPAASDPLAPVAWMAGGVWRGEVRGPDGKTTKIETRVERELNGKALSFSSSFDGVMQYRGFYAYDAAKKTIVFSYPSADGGLANGSVEQKGDALVWEFNMTESNGSVSRYQVSTLQQGADDYTWTLFASRKDAWVELFAIHYHRTES
jgi:hypothetical protein